MPKITNGTSGEQQILLKHQGSYGQQIPGCIFTSTHRGRHQRAKPNRFAARRGFWGGAVLPERNTSALGNDTVQVSRAGPCRATGDGATTLCNFKNCTFSSIWIDLDQFKYNILTRISSHSFRATHSPHMSNRPASSGMVCLHFAKRKVVSFNWY